ADRAQMQVLRKRADIVIMGASTLRAYQKFCGVRGARPQRQPANAIISHGLEGVSSDLPFFADPKLRRILFVTHPLSAARQKAFGRGSEIVQLKPHGAPIAAQLIAALKKRGFESILVEGGGGLMWDFASRNLIDEYHVTLTPKIVGGRESPTLVEGAGFSPAEILELKLIRCKKLGDELYLTYRRRK
ncbi:MAG: RibD family protein, partial [Oligoflexia bacterium]|nr:RibD family protein [Oligoflexia bacterium]